MGYLTEKRLTKIINDLNFNSHDFVETGTYTGRTILPISKLFDNCYTIEIIKELSKLTEKKALRLNIKNIKFFIGDSSKELSNILSEIENDNIVIFLDAHSSGYESNKIENIHLDSKIRAKNNIKTNDKFKFSCITKKNKLSDLDVPLLKELEIINNFNKNFLIIIDDFDLFNKNTEYADWTNINIGKCKNIFKNKIVNSKIYNNPDQLILQIKKL
jgi:hypothetical protein